MIKMMRLMITMNTPEHSKAPTHNKNDNDDVDDNDDVCKSEVANATTF
jgi:hypothetical protein